MLRKEMRIKARDSKLTETLAHKITKNAVGMPAETIPWCPEGTVEALTIVDNAVDKRS